MPDLGRSPGNEIRLERMRYAVSQQITPEMARSLQFDEHRDVLTGRLVQNLIADVMAEQLPPTHVSCSATYEHPAALGTGQTDDPRHATWFDMWKDAVKGRWWARMLGGRRWPVRYVRTPVRYVHREPVQCDHRIRVDIQGRWTYPKATTVLPANRWGPVVLRSSASAMSVPWPSANGDMPW